MVRALSVLAVILTSSCHVTIKDLEPVPCPSDGQCPDGFYCAGDQFEEAFDSAFHAGSSHCAENCAGPGCQCKFDVTCLPDAEHGDEFACLQDPCSGPGCVSNATFSCNDDCISAEAGASTVLLCRVPRTWDDARKDCEARGMRLPVIKDATRAADLAQAVAATQTVVPEWWIGLEDQQTEGTFVWVDGSPLTFSNFAPGEPTNSPLSPEGEDCVQIIGDGVDVRADTGLWNDLSCTRLISHICEPKE